MTEVTAPLSLLLRVGAPPEHLSPEGHRHLEQSPIVWVFPLLQPLDTFPDCDTVFWVSHQRRSQFRRVLCSLLDGSVVVGVEVLSLGSRPISSLRVQVHVAKPCLALPTQYLFLSPGAATQHAAP